MVCRRFVAAGWCQSAVMVCVGVFVFLVSQWTSVSYISVSKRLLCMCLVAATRNGFFPRGRGVRQ